MTEETKLRIERQQQRRHDDEKAEHRMNRGARNPTASFRGNLLPSERRRSVMQSHSELIVPINFPRQLQFSTTPATGCLAEHRGTGKTAQV
jgi:hypothetical protein